MALAKKKYSRFPNLVWRSLPRLRAKTI
jgi:hypothetical protein